MTQNENKADFDIYTEEQEIISLNNFLILNFVTLGLYEIWWIYKAWRFFAQKDRLDIMPAVRAITNIFFLYSLLRRIYDYGKAHGYAGEFSPVLFYIGFILVNFLGVLPAPFNLLSLLGMIFFIQPFNALNTAKINDKKIRVKIQYGFNGRQIFLLIFGVLIWTAFIGGTVAGLE